MAHRGTLPLVFGLLGVAAIALLLGGGPAQPGQAAALQQAAAPAQAKPDGQIRIVSVRANPADPNVITASLADGRKVQMGTTGLNNVSVGAPVLLQANAGDATVPVTKITWALAGPTASKSALDARDQEAARFTPDVPGIYKVDLTLANDAGSGKMASLQIRAGEYIGVAAGRCADCHPTQAEDWAETGHATLLHEEINGGADPAASHYGEQCVRCHTTGYYIGADNGGFAAVQAATGWSFPALDSIQSGTDSFNQMPRALRQLANIGCEDCHGPAKDHVLKGAKMATGLDEGVCNQCHDGGGHHIKGTEFRNAAHQEKDAQAWTYPVGPTRQACVRCHSGAGYVSFINEPKEQASWDNSMQTLSCASCHDPHSDKNKFQLRIVGKPVEAVGITKDFGLSATCVECHNARTTAADAAKASFPHYSAAGEMLSDSGGVTYGQTVPNSPHARLVGAQPVKDPADPTGKTMLFGGAAPGPCVDCHMWPTADQKSGYQYQVGEHSFNVISPDGQFENLASCQSCHKGVTSLDDFKSKLDYDGNGKAETVQAEVAGLLKVLQGAIGNAGVKVIDGHPYFDAADVAKSDIKVRNAIYNYLFVRGVAGEDGKVSAIHNFRRSVALLQLSYQDLTGREVPRAALVMATPTSVPATPTAVAAAAQAPAPTATPRPAGGLSVTSYTALMKGGDGGPVVAPGDPEGSRLLKVGTSAHPAQLTDDDAALIAAWIAGGAQP